MTPSEICEAGKNGLAGKYGACRLTQAAEAKAGAGVCPSENDQSSIGQRILDLSDAIGLLLSAQSVEECGNGIMDTGEDCDAGQLGAPAALYTNWSSTTSSTNPQYASYLYLIDGTTSIKLKSSSAFFRAVRSRS